jgi:hypothetical protein
MFTVTVAGSSGVTVAPAVALPSVVTVVVVAFNCAKVKTGPVGHSGAVGRRHNCGAPPTAVIRAPTSPLVVRPVNVTVNVGLCPELAIGSVDRSTVLLLGIATLVHPVIEVPELFLTVSVAEVKVLSVFKTKASQP